MVKFLCDHQKPNGKLCVCLDPTDLNQYIVRPVCNSLTLDEIVDRLKGAVFFAVFNTTKGFFHIPMDADSQLLTAMLTPYGIYIYNVLAMGLADATDIFETVIRDLLKDLNGVLNIADDVLVFGNTYDSFRNNVISFLDHCVKEDIHLNPDKIQIDCEKVPFFGHTLSKEGVHLDKAKVELIQNWPIPNNVKELQLFLGTVNYLSKFLAFLSDLHAPLQGLLKKDTDFQWTETHTQAFNRLKEHVSLDISLQFFDCSKPLYIEVDASKRGIGSVMLQPDTVVKNTSTGDIPNNLRPIAYASKTLSHTESNYSNIERELLGVVFSCLHFKHFAYGHKVTVITDHKPLVSLFKKSLGLSSPRLARMLLQILDFDLDVVYQLGSQMHLSNAISRLSSHNPDKGDTIPGLDVSIHDVSVCTGFNTTSLQTIREHTQKDDSFHLLLDHIHQGFPASIKEMPDCIKPYFTFRDELAVVNGLILKGDRILIPKSLREQCLKCLHKSHMGITKTLAHARTSVFWPDMGKDITNFLSTCSSCARYQDMQ